jgi:hypothetical protein
MYLRAFTPVIVAFLALALAPAVPASAAEDPERNSSTPAAWSWWRGQSPSELEHKEKAYGQRVISINADGPLGTTFSAALVRNTGSYKRDGDWFHNKTADQVVALTDGKKRRLVDLEPYRRFGKLRFAGVTVPNTSESGKWWWWNYDLSAMQVENDINKHRIRLVDLAVYQRGGQRRFAYVGIKNEGSDARAWWWYQDVSPAFVQKKAEEHGARLVDIERHRSNTLTVLMVKNQGTFARHVYGVSEGFINRYVQSQGVRITDLERHGSKYYATMIDNVGAETARIRSLLRASPYRHGYFGAFSKRVGGPTYVGLAHRAAYQPLSVLKLVPHLYVMDRFDRGQADLESEISWLSPKGRPDDHICPGHLGATQTYSDTLRNTLHRGLWESLGRSHETLLNIYTPEAITERVQEMGLENTVMYYGCEHSGKPNWLANRTTLTDMGELFEGVDSKAFFPNRWQETRDEFYGLMADWPAEWLRPVVESEAAKVGKSGVVDAFMQKVTIDGKGGGADSGSDDDGWLVGRSLSYRVALPFRVPSRRGTGTTTRSFVGGFFVNDTKGPCLEARAHEDPGSVSHQCLQWVKSMGDTFVSVAAEVQRLPIREALKTW